MFRTMGATRMARTRPLASMVGGPRPWGSFRSVNHPAGGPTGQPVEPEPTKTTKDRLDIYNRDVELRTDFTSLKGAFRLVGWQLSAQTAIILFMGSAIFYFIDRVEKHFPAAVVAVLAEKNYTYLHAPTPPSIEMPASTPPPKTGK